MNTFIVVCGVFCIMLLVFIAYAFIINKDSAPVSAQKKRLLPTSANNATSSPDEANTSEVNASEAI
ncbi:MAG TPA: hypothetical protein VH415_13220 [Nitrososphaeraceae archaeon]|jgi:hypothetical protein